MRPSPLLQTLSDCAFAMILASGMLFAQDAGEVVSRREILLRAARNLVQARQYGDAIRYFKDYIAEWPDDLPVAIEYAGVLVQAGHVEEATSILQSILQREPDNRRALGLLVDALMMRKDFATAAALLEGVVARRPDDTELRRRLADACAWAGRYDDALKHYRIVLAASAAETGKAGDAAIRKRLLDVLYWAGRYDDYLAESTNYLRDYPKDLTVRLVRVDLYAARRDFAAAAEECRAIIAAQPDHRVARARLAQFLAWLGRREEAIQAYQEALAISPEDVGLRREYGEMLLWSGRYEEALPTFRRLHADVPADETVVREYLEVIANLNTVQDAERQFVSRVHESKFLAGSPLHPGTLAALARALRNIGRGEDALAVFRRAVEATPRDTVLRLQYADLLAALGHAAEAEREYELLLEKVGRTTGENNP